MPNSWPLSQVKAVADLHSYSENVRVAGDVRGHGSFPAIEDPTVTTMELKGCGEHSGLRPAEAGVPTHPSAPPSQDAGSLTLLQLPHVPFWVSPPLCLTQGQASMVIR